jgi:hypothetical protein
MAGKASPIGLRTWVWILAGLFVVCTPAADGHRPGPGHAALTAAEDNLVSLRQLRQTFDLANLVSAERGPANSLGADRPMRPSRRGWPRSWRPRASGSTPPCCSWTPCSRPIRAWSTSMGCWPTRNVACKSARAAVDRVAAQPQDARRVEDVERAISGMFAVVDRLHC